MSDTTITPEERAELRKVASNASALPWKVEGCYSSNTNVRAIRADGVGFAVTHLSAMRDNWAEDAAYIVAACNIAPLLLDALEAAEAEKKHTDAQFSQVCLDNALLRTRILTVEADVARLTKALETQRNLTASAHATAQAAWGGEIPSPFPGHKRASEDDMADHFAHLNCPLCGGSGHIGDCDATAAEAVARLTAERDWLADKLPTESQNCRDLWRGPEGIERTMLYVTKKKAADAWAEAARKAVAGDGKA